MLEQKEFTLNSGKKLIVNIANFVQGYKLAQALMKCAKRMEIKFDKESVAKFDFNKITENPSILAIAGKLILEGLTDPAVTQVFWEMAQKCNWNGLKINEDLFNNQFDARQDFFQMQFIIIRENILPFFPTLRTTLEEMPK